MSEAVQEVKSAIESVTDVKPSTTESVTVLSTESVTERKKRLNKERQQRYRERHSTKKDNENDVTDDAGNEDNEQPEIEYLPPKKARKIRRSKSERYEAKSGFNFKYLMIAGAVAVAALLAFILLRRKGNDSGSSPIVGDGYAHFF